MVETEKTPEIMPQCEPIKGNINSRKQASKTPHFYSKLRLFQAILRCFWSQPNFLVSSAAPRSVPSWANTQCHKNQFIYKVDFHF